MGEAPKNLKVIKRGDKRRESWVSQREILNLVFLLAAVLLRWATVILTLDDLGFLVILCLAI